jgi:pyruvate dehydrogenase E2 component (dihydrolipoamide acetyltransferase)
LATNVIMPVLGMVQDSGKIVSWLKKVGDPVSKGEILFEVETDKAVQELESPASGIISQILFQEGDDVPVTQVVAIILTPEEYRSNPIAGRTDAAQRPENNPAARETSHAEEPSAPDFITASPLAARIAQENNLDLSRIKPEGGRVEKSDVLSYLAKHAAVSSPTQHNGRILASPKARRLAREANQDISQFHGSGPDGVVLAQDVERGASKTASRQPVLPESPAGIPVQTMTKSPPASQPGTTSTIWRRMAEHTTQSWVTAPHFYLQRNVNVSRLLTWRSHLQKNSEQKITINDLLVLITSRALFKHKKINVIWQDEKITILNDINISLAVAVDDGLVVPVIHHADRLNAFEIAGERKELVTRAQSSKLRLEDISDGTFTISNLGMFGVDSFNAVLNGPQAAILAVGRIVDQVIPLNGAPVIQPVMNLSVSFDHRAVDGASGAKFLETLADMIEEPLMLMG